MRVMAVKSQVINLTEDLDMVCLWLCQITRHFIFILSRIFLMKNYNKLSKNCAHDEVRLLYFWLIKP